MKKIFFLIALSLLIISCGTTVEMERSVLVAGFDFTTYSEKGFLFTPETYPSNYESVGILNTTVFPSVKKWEVKYYDNPSDYEPLGNTMEWVVEKLKPSIAIEEMYKSAIKMGANAIINFNIKWVTKMNGQLQINGYEVSGFAIKRK